MHYNGVPLWPRDVTPAQVKVALDTYQEWGIHKAAERSRMTISTIRAYIKRTGVKLNPRLARRMGRLRMSRTQIAEFDAAVTRLYTKGRLSTNQIAEALDCTPQMVQKSLEYSDTPRRTLSESTRARRYRTTRQRATAVGREYAQRTAEKGRLPPGDRQRISEATGVPVESLNRYVNHRLNPYGPNYELTDDEGSKTRDN